MGGDLMKVSFVIVGTLTWLGVAATGCGPKYPNCEQDKHCQEGEYCVNNLCQQCRDNGDCPAGQECQEGGCREIVGYCSDSADCAEGQVCRENRCGPCLSAGDCAEGQVCMDGICGKAECSSTEDCPAGLSCVDYRCQPDASPTSQIGPGDCDIEPVFFEFDSSEVTSDMRERIAMNQECLTERGGRVTLEGHCDPRGTTEYNMALGERRSRVVHKILKSMGTDPGDLRVVSKGEEEATGHDETGWSKDRRVEFK
jgi:peptidoglycan-associated lipoprotein